ncbi:MFS transporter [Streptomyces sp. AJS327]|uniref:MDR family MFS transporter n=1 Tax=Streptomyces sp. AJS327 TaxID=2545265 RepID=UPI00182BCE0C|nr:MFS transporter [Streptomyces sp. AJS327]MBA0053308.1 MFS transporter [Streptomyces sp. AJS327]
MGEVSDARQRKPAGAAGKPRVRVRDVWRESPLAVRSLLAGTAINRLGGFVQVFMVLYLTHRGFSAAQAGAALGVYGAGTVLGVLLGGWMSDRLGPRRTIVTTLLGSAVLLPLVLHLDSYPAILAVIGVSGAASQAYRPASTSMISELIPVERHIMIFAMVRLAINVGTTAAPLLGAALLRVSWDVLFWGEALAVVAFSLVARTTLPPGTGRGDGRGDERSGRAADPGDGTGPDSRTSARGPGVDTGGGPRPSYRAVLADRRYLVFLLAMFASSMIYVQHVSTLPLTVRHLGMSTTVYAALVALNGALVITCELLVATVVQRWPTRIAVVCGVGLTGVGMSLYALPWGLAALVIATLVWSLGEIIGYPTLFFAYPAQAGPPALRGRYLGASNSLYGLGTALGPFLGVLLWNRLHEGLWLACGLVGVLAVSAAWYGVRPAPPADSTPPHDTRPGPEPPPGSDAPQPDSGAPRPPADQPSPPGPVAPQPGPGEPQATPDGPQSAASTPQRAADDPRRPHHRREHGDHPERGADAHPSAPRTRPGATTPPGRPNPKEHA